MNFLNDFKNVELPAVTVRVDEDSLRNLFITGFMLGASLILVAAVVFKTKTNG